MDDSSKKWVYKSSLHELMYMPKILIENASLENILKNYDVNTNSMTLAQKKKNFTFSFNREDIARLTGLPFQGDKLMHFSILMNNNDKCYLEEHFNVNTIFL